MLLAPDRHARINGAVMRAHANATAFFNGASTGVPVIFGDPYALGSAGPLGMATSQPQFDCADADVPVGAHGSGVVVGDVSYFVAELRPDGSGMTTVILEASA